MDVAPLLSPAEVIEHLALRPHPEGGYFRETFRAAREVETPRGPRSLATGIIFLLTEGSRSRFHRLRSEELWVHQAGAPVDLLMLRAASGAGERRLGVVALATPDALPGGSSEPAGRFEPQAVVPAGVWQAARVVPGATPGWGLVACMVFPGFDYADFELAERGVLLCDFPEHADLIAELT
jgi:predicted cupin superfamily sugar epimerase